jgi:hypothetical protein
MAVRTKTPWRLTRADVTYHWVGGRNVTWQLTHEPTGIRVEGETKLDKKRFTKKRLRIAEEQLHAKLFGELERRVGNHLRQLTNPG